MANLISFSTKFINVALGTGYQASPVQVEIRNSLNVLKDTLVLPTGITETDLGGGDFEYSVANYDVSNQVDFPGNFISVLWSAEVSGTPYADIGANVAINSGFVEPTDFGPYEAPYATIAEANEYFGFNLDAADWNSFTDNQKFSALFMASDHIDELNFWGRKFFATNTVRRQFPRILPANLFEYTAVEEVGIPQPVKRATFEQAVYLLRQYRQRTVIGARQDLQNQGVTGVSRLGSSESWDLERRRKHEVCSRAYRHLEPFIFRGGMSGCC